MPGESQPEAEIDVLVEAADLLKYTQRKKCSRCSGRKYFVYTFILKMLKEHSVQYATSYH